MSVYAEPPVKVLPTGCCERWPEKCISAPFILAELAMRLWQYVHPRLFGVTPPLAAFMSGSVREEETMYEVSGAASEIFRVWQLEQPLPPGSTETQ